MASYAVRLPFHRIGLPCRPTNHQRIRNFFTTTHRSGILGLDRHNSRTLWDPKPPPRNPNHNHIQIYPGPPSERAHCREPLNHITTHQLAALDPTGARRRLFDKSNPEGAKVGDILLVRSRAGEPFAGVCMNIRRRGVDTGILLRNHLTRVGVEMWFKVFSPNVAGVEVVQRKTKRARRARLYYYRLPKHDLGSLDGVVAQYLRQRQALRGGGAAKGRDANADSRKAKTKAEVQRKGK